MNKSSKYKILLILALIVIVLLAYYLMNSKHEELITVTVKNESTEKVNDLNLYLSNEESFYEVSLEANEKKTIKISYNDTFHEGSLMMKYNDFDGNEHEETIIGYVEKGQSIKTTLIIKAVDAQGVIEFEVK